MKTLKTITGVIMIVVMLMVGVLPVFATESSNAIILKSTQMYPIITTEEWKDMSRQERVNACQLSEEDVAGISTEDLLQYVINYPFMIDIYAFSTFEMGFEHVCDEFGAISWLLNREDYAQVLIDTYSSIPVESSSMAKSVDYYQNIWDLGVLEILITQPAMTESLSNDEIADLMENIESKAIEKDSAIDIYGGSKQSFSQALSEQPDSAVALAATSTVKTPAGTSVAVYNYSSITDWTSSEKATLNTQTLASYPTATLIADASKKYNCHSYAWYSRSTSNYYWMDDPTAYMTDGSYYSASRQIGNIAYWYNTFNGVSVPVHSGVVQEHMQSGAYYGACSKWGNLGVYNHKYDDCPYSGTISYWAKA